MRRISVFLYFIPIYIHIYKKTAADNVSEKEIMEKRTEKYVTIKRRLLNLFSQSEESKVRYLLRTCRIGDEKSSHFL